MNQSIKAYLAAIGAKGGSAGKGKAKRRTKAQCRKAAKVRWDKVKQGKEIMKYQINNDSRLNAFELRQLNCMSFALKHLGEGSYEAAMYDRPKFRRQDSPVSRGSGTNEHEAKLDAFLSWSRK